MHSVIIENDTNLDSEKYALIEISDNSEGAIYLTQLTFSYGILHFKYARELKLFVLSSLAMSGVLTELHKEGFARRKIGKGYTLIQVKGSIISEVNPEIMRNFMTAYVNAIKEDISFTYKGQPYDIPALAIKETYFRNSNNIFNDTWLEHLEIHDSPVLKDTEFEMYFPFTNGLVKVSKDGIKIESWENISGTCVWQDQLINRDFTHIKDCKSAEFYKFLLNVTNKVPARIATVLAGIGYLLHHYFRESEGQALVLYDESVTDISNPMGGTGKGLIVQALKQCRSVAKLDGKHLDPANKFKYEGVTPSSQIVWLDDVKPDFPFEMLHSNLSDGWTIERKYHSQFFIEPKNSPKTVICSNSIIKGGGTTNKRRLFAIELSDFYSKQIIRGDEKPIEDTHNGLFFSASSWDTLQYNMFYSIMFGAAHKYLNTGLVPFEGININLNRFRQATNEDFASWVVLKNFKANKPYDTKHYYDEFVAMFYGFIHAIGQRTFTGFLKEYSIYKRWSFKITRSNGVAFFTF